MGKLGWLREKRYSMVREVIHNRLSFNSDAHAGNYETHNQAVHSGTHGDAASYPYAHKVCLHVNLCLASNDQSSSHLQNLSCFNLKHKTGRMSPADHFRSVKTAELPGYRPAEITQRRTELYAQEI